ncbi:MAG TPA: O-antigen ligase family protein [Bryobacteraceae bacterium]|jgi:O-antigen ligase|nr:O-antigen ligase family protein [Bryobacteraceae bacterium]
MSSSGVQAPPVTLSAIHKRIQQFGAVALFLVLAAYTLSTLDDLELQRSIMGTVALAFGAVYLVVSFRERLVLAVPPVCLLLMAAYGAAQTMWSPAKIVNFGWFATSFWLVAGLIALVAVQVFQSRSVTRHFRTAFAIFGGAVCLLELLQQGAHTNKYYGLFQSRWAEIFGPFGYHNNFAAFIELSLPVTLWLGLVHRKPNYLFLLLAGMQVGSVAACGSRAGLLLAVLEVLTVLPIAYMKNRRAAILPALGAAVGLTVIFVLIAGFHVTQAKLEQRDQLGPRWQIDLSSLAMIRAHPLLGWGLGTYVPVYPKFARYDDGTYVNRAHNDWLEWTAEGGIFFSGLMLVVFIWSLRPAIRSGWGIGVIAICLHALVDYPFARMGVCGWYFALVSMLACWDPHEDDHRPRRHIRSEELDAVDAGGQLSAPD